MNAGYLGEYFDRATAMARVEDVIEPNGGIASIAAKRSDWVGHRAVDKTEKGTFALRETENSAGRCSWIS